MTEGRRFVHKPSETDHKPQGLSECSSAAWPAEDRLEIEVVEDTVPEVEDIVPVVASAVDTLTVGTESVVVVVVEGRLFGEDRLEAMRREEEMMIERQVHNQRIVVVEEGTPVGSSAVAQHKVGKQDNIALVVVVA
jgi:sulfur carrier protein ThiS